MDFNLPKDYRPYIDKYFLRAKTILEKEKLNPVVKAQVFIRKGNCKVYGMNEAIAIIKKYTDWNLVSINALQEGSYFENGECLMTIKAPIQEIIALETMYLGVLSAETTLRSKASTMYGEEHIDLPQIRKNMKTIVDLVSPRPVSYFGARHWRYDRDFEISQWCKAGGAKNCSTDEGAKAWGKDCEGIGTIPHALETIYHWKYGIENAVFMATTGFGKLRTDKWERKINDNTPIIALVDYANREILDSLRIAHYVDGIRIDTCGENYMQGLMNFEKGYCSGRGVSIQGVYLVRKLLNDSGYEDVKIILSSGFGNPEKVKAFLEGEEILEIKLFDGLGVGGVFESRMATMDIIEVEGKEIHKVGRLPKDDNRLVKVM